VVIHRCDDLSLVPDRTEQRALASLRAPRTSLRKIAALGVSARNGTPFAAKVVPDLIADKGLVNGAAVAAAPLSATPCLGRRASVTAWLRCTS